MKTRWLFLWAICLCFSSTVAADEGMWLFNSLPKEYLQKKYGFTPSDEWADKVMKSCVRFNVGGSASFISSNGLVLTNHHVASDTLYKLSDKEHNYLKDGFLAKSFDQELKAPDLELNQLVNIEDVTDRVRGAVKPGMSTTEAAEARRAVIASIQQEATDKTKLRSDVVTLYGGGRFHLYQYKKYTDVRLVWAPESAAAFFGGDADNFEYPRYDLDATIFRVYEDGKPAETPHFFKWSANGPAENELVFVSGNPGSTSRIYTYAALKYQRDHRVPFTMNALRRREILLQQFGLNGEEAARIAKDDLFGVQNSRKAYMGEIQGLQNPAFMQEKQKAELALIEKIKSNPQLKGHVTAFDQIAEVERQRLELLTQGITLRTTLFGIAQTLVQMAEEDKKPNEKRLDEYRDSARESLEQQLFSPAPIYPELEQTLLADSLARLCELRGADDEVCVKILDGKSPLERAAELVKGTRLIDVEARKQLAKSGDGIRMSDDPMVKLALLIDPAVRELRTKTEALDEIETQAYEKIAEAIFATQGTAAYPDATFTLRLAFGPVKGYEEEGKTIPAWTDFAGAFDHEASHGAKGDYQLPESWGKAREKFNLETPLNFVSTADIIGGNSGSPVFNKDLELVGLIFDGNIQSLTGDYQYSETQSRSVSVHSSAIRDALRYIYGAENVANQLGK
jgi:Peptidase S46